MTVVKVLLVKIVHNSPESPKTNTFTLSREAIFDRRDEEVNSVLKTTPHENKARLFANTPVTQASSLLWAS